MKHAQKHTTIPVHKSKMFDINPIKKDDSKN